MGGMGMVVVADGAMVVADGAMAGVMSAAGATVMVKVGHAGGIGAGLTASMQNGSVDKTANTLQR